MCMHRLEYLRLNRKDRSKNMRGTTLEVAMLADVSGTYRAISYVYQCVTGPLSYEPLTPPLDILDSHWSTKRNVNGAALES